MRLAALVLLLSGCGYSWQYDKSEAPLPSGQLPRVAVIPFDNRTFRRGLEIELSRHMNGELRARSPRSTVRPDEADWLLTGTIVEADVRVITGDADDRVRESEFILTVEVVLKDRATEKVLRTYSVTEREPFSDRAGRIAYLEQAEEQVLRDAAEAIVYWLETSHPERAS